MAQKKVGVYQIEAGKDGLGDLGERLNSIDNVISNVNTDIQEDLTAHEAELARINEAVMAMASAPVSVPIFNDVETIVISGATPEVSKITVTSGATSDGNVSISLNGTPLSVSVSSGDSASTVASKIKTVVDASADYVATLDGAVVTITAVNGGDETDITFNADTTGVVSTAEVVTQGTDGLNLSQNVILDIPNNKTYVVGKGNLLVLRNGIQQIPNGGDYTEVDENSIQFNADVLKDGDVITFIIGNASKLNYTMNVTYYTGGVDDGRIQTVIYNGDIDREITYTYTAEGKIATETVVENGVTTTKTYTYTNGKIASITSVVA